MINGFKKKGWWRRATAFFFEEMRLRLFSGGFRLRRSVFLEETTDLLKEPGKEGADLLEDEPEKAGFFHLCSGHKGDTLPQGPIGGQKFVLR